MAMLIKAPQLIVLALTSACVATSEDDRPDAGQADASFSVDPLEIASGVDESELSLTIQDLEAFGSRYTFGEGDEAACDYLVGRLEEYGLDVELDPFEVSGEAANNIIAKKPGLEEPSVVYIFSAHYDSTSSDTDSAPGADDNASGVAAVLEAARVLMPYTFRNSLWFVLTAAEEQGSKGSLHMVSWLSDEGVDVRGVIAPDMIGYWPLGEDDSMDILGDGESTHLVDLMAEMATALGVGYKKWIFHEYCWGDDHSSFQERGFPAIAPMDCVEAHNVPSSGEETPHYHEPTDLFDTLQMQFTTKVAGVIVATFADLGATAP